MKKIFIYFATAMMLASCSSESSVTEEVDKPGENPFPEYNGVVATLPDVEFEGDDDPVTRATLIYDYEKKLMKASWKQGDEVGVYPITANGKNLSVNQSKQQKWIVDPETPLIENTSSVTGVFVSADVNIKALESYAKYISYYPYTSAGESYDAIPVSYRNQKQMQNVNVNAYYSRSKDDNLNVYKASEILASAHLGAYDYLVSDAIATPNGGAHFLYTRLGSVSRFFFEAPEKVVYDAMIFYNADANFTLDATMNVSEKTLTATETGHSLTLKFGDEGFDLTDATKNPGSFYHDYGYIIAYLMSAPIQLKSLDKCTLYLLGHLDITNDQYNNISDEEEKALYSSVTITKDGTPEVVYRKNTYYKAALTKYNMDQNKVQRWSPVLGKDEPIKFEAMTVQQWNEEYGYENPKGTETW